MCMCMRNYVYYIRIYFKYFLDPDFFFVRGDGREEARRGGGVGRPLVRMLHKKTKKSDRNGEGVTHSL